LIAEIVVGKHLPKYGIFFHHEDANRHGDFSPDRVSSLPPYRGRPSLDPTRSPSE
jgi:hypothetical protein